MIAGIGIDMIALGRMERAVGRFGDRLLNRLLTADERTAAHGDLVGYVSGRFAAKEAALKALGTGMAAGVRWHDVEVLTEPSGAPRLRLHGQAYRRARAMGVTVAHISLTHDREYAAAVAVLEVTPPAVGDAPGVRGPGQTGREA